MQLRWLLHSLLASLLTHRKPTEMPPRFAWPYPWDSEHLNISELHTEHVKKGLLPITTNYSISIPKQCISYTYKTKCAFSLGDLYEYIDIG